MDYRKMWYELKGMLSKRAGDKTNMNESVYKNIILNMTDIENSEYLREAERNSPEEKGTFKTDIPPFILEKILGGKLVKTLEEFRKEVEKEAPEIAEKRRIFVLESVDIPKALVEEAHRKGYTIVGVSAESVFVGPVGCRKPSR